MSTDLAAVTARRETVMAHAREVIVPRFNARGQWAVSLREPRYRERHWHCLSLLAGEPEHVALANTVIETSTPDNNDFQAFFTALILALHEDKLTDRARRQLLDELRAIADHGYRHLFRYTENCGLMNAFGQLEAGRRFNEPHRIEKAQSFVEAAVHFARTYGAGREYFSVNYLGVTLAAAGCIAGLAAEPEHRALGNEIQAWLWEELAACWHPNLHWTTGPSGRSYSVNSLAAFSGLHVMAWLGFGDEVCPSPMSMGLFTDARSCGSRPDNLHWHQAAVGWRACVPYQVPAAAGELAREKPLPYELTANTQVGTYRDYEERTDLTEDETRALGGWFSRGGPHGGIAHVPALTLHPRGRTHLTSYMAEDYGLGAATQQMTGQSDTLYAAWRVAAEVKHLRDIRTMYMRYVVNDALEQEFDVPEGFTQNLGETGRGGAVQSGPLGLAWYAAGDQHTQGVETLRTCLVCGELFTTLDEVWLGDQRLAGDEGATAEPDWVFLRDGDVFVGLHPLLTQQLGGDAVRVVKFPGTRAITFVNYDGPARDFDPTALRQVGGGAVVCLGAAREYQGGFAEFRATCAAASVLDEVYESHRHLRVLWGERLLELIWDLQTENLLWVRDEAGFVSEQRFAHGPARG